MKVSKVFIIIVLALIIIGVFSAGYLGLKSQQTAEKVSPSATPTIPAHAIATGDGSYAMPTSVSGQMKFVSPKLGISFLYQYRYDEGAAGYSYVSILEKNNKAYLYDAKTEPYTKGRYIEVFSKNPQDSLVKTINKTILADYLQEGCFAQTSPYYYENKIPNKYDSRFGQMVTRF